MILRIILYYIISLILKNAYCNDEVLNVELEWDMKNSNDYILRICNMLTNETYNFPITEKCIDINVSHVHTGMYILSLLINGETRDTKKICIN